MQVDETRPLHSKPPRAEGRSGRPLLEESIRHPEPLVCTSSARPQRRIWRRTSKASARPMPVVRESHQNETVV
jgi:hypothetical protein